MKSKSGILFFKGAVLLLPVLILLASYFYYDPFRVIYHYDSYYQNTFIDLNRDYVSTEMYLRHPEQYDAFIFGNSRSRSFLCSDWQKYIPGAHPFHYDASGEVLKGMEDKMNLIDKKGKFDHALILLDRTVFESPDYKSGILYASHPSESGKSGINFHLSYFKSYLSEFFFIRYIDYYYNRKNKRYLNGILSKTSHSYNLVTNDYYMNELNKELENDPEAYHKNHPGYFLQRDTGRLVYEERMIENRHMKMLWEIKKVIDKHHTQYKIIVLPDYFQYKFLPEDIEKLESVFGKENVYDFSGVNEYSRDVNNFYETIHFRPKVARDILQTIYEPRRN